MRHTNGPVPHSSDTRISSIPVPPMLRVLPSTFSSVSDEMWSRGSVYERQLADLQQVGPTVAVPPVDKVESLYQHEYGGVVVYDHRFSIAGETLPSRNSTETIRPELRKKGVELLPEGDKRKYLAMKQYTPMPEYEVEGELTVPQDALRFDSRFESGNLKRAVRRQDREYFLLIQEDTESRGHTQWYYFSVRNPKAGSYRFHIINLYKADSLYREGMLPAVRSTKKAAGWTHAGRDVLYAENDFPLPNRPGCRAFTLSFTYDFEIAEDLVYFAHAVPYTYSELTSWSRDLGRRCGDVVRVDPLCHTLAGNACEMLTITSDITTYQSFQSEVLEWNMTASGRKLLRSRIENEADKRNTGPHAKKKGVVLTARVHPGETAGSWMLRGAVEFLTSNTPEAAFLRTHYVVKVVPMLNPDGVRYGNYRCSVLGVDLNRRWKNPSRYMHPTIYFAKKMMQVLSEHHEIVLFCDFHGHSCKRNAFMYGCNQSFLQISDRKSNIIAKMIPLLLSQRNPALAWSHCHFRLDRFKESTARVVAYNEFRIVNSYTLEASFYGPDDDRAAGRPSPQFQVEDYQCVGRDLMAVSACFATKPIFIRKLTYIRDLLRQMKVSPRPLEKSKSAVINGPHKQSEAKFNARSSMDQYKDLEDTSDPPETAESELAENQLWATLFEYEERIADDNASAGSDSSCSEDYEEEAKLKKPQKVAVGRQSRLKSSEPRLLAKRQSDTSREAQRGGIGRKIGTMVPTPKLYRLERGEFSKSPLVTSSKSPLRQYAPMKVGFRTEKGPQLSPSDSTDDLVSSFEPFVLVSQQGVHSQAAFNSMSRLISRPSFRANTMQRTPVRDGVPVLEFVRRALQAKRDKFQRAVADPEEVASKREVRKKSTFRRDRGSRG